MGGGCGSHLPSSYQSDDRKWLHVAPGHSMISEVFPNQSSSVILPKTPAKLGWFVSSQPDCFHLDSEGSLEQSKR